MSLCIYVQLMVIGIIVFIIINKYLVKTKHRELNNYLLLYSL